jgi:hypothetical protein
VNIFQRASSSVTPSTPSIVEPVQALINSLPASEKLLTTVEYADCVTPELPVRPDKLFHNVS